MGNVKVLMFVCCEHEKPVVPRFRGEVNSVGIVVQRRAGGNDHWKMAAFAKERVQGFKPSFPGAAMPLHALREHLLTTAINGHYAVVQSPPYRDILSRVYQEQLANMWALVQTYVDAKGGGAAVKDKDKKRSSRSSRRRLTKTLSNEK